MAKPVRGRAGRQQRREETLERYGAELAAMIIKQIEPPPGARMMHLGSPGAIALADAVAPFLAHGELVVVAYTYDEMEEIRAALAGVGNVEVINEIDDIDPDEPPYDLITCIVPYHLGRDYVEELLAAGLQLLDMQGTMVLGGDRQQGFERDLQFLGAKGSQVTPLVQNGNLRVVAATKPGRGGGLRYRPETA